RFAPVLIRLPLRSTSDEVQAIMLEYQSQTNISRRPLLFWLGTVLVTLWFCSLILAAPLAQASGHDRAADALYRSFGILCHQLPERSFFIDGYKLAVCSRCTGIYAG